MKGVWAMCTLAVLLAPGCTRTGRASLTPGSVAPHLTAPPLPSGLADGCQGTSPTTVKPDDFGSIHTIPPRTAPVNYEVAVAPSTVCPGGTVLVAVRVHNKSPRMVTVSPDLIVRWPAEHLSCCNAVTVPARGDATVVEQVVIPLYVSVGSKTLTFGDYPSGEPTGDREAPLDVVAPHFTSSTG